jgi:rare lipoprotein A
MHRLFPQFRADLLLVAIIALAVLSACAVWKPGPNHFEQGYSKNGHASWYGPGFHGKRAANGEIYDQNGLTAAHRYMPFGTLVQVTRRDTGAKVVVRITDRGPFVRGRILDLSKGAAKVLDAIGPGVIPVHLKVIATPEQISRANGTRYTIQLGKFASADGADKLRQKLEPRIPGLRLLASTPPGSVRLVTRHYPDYSRAKRVAHLIRRDLSPGAFVIEEAAP